MSAVCVCVFVFVVCSLSAVHQPGQCVMCVVFLCGVLSANGMSDQVIVPCVWSFCVLCCQWCVSVLHVVFLCDV